MLLKLNCRNWFDLVSVGVICCAPLTAVIRWFLESVSAFWWSLCWASFFPWRMFSTFCSREQEPQAYTPYMALSMAGSQNNSEHDKRWIGRDMQLQRSEEERSPLCRWASASRTQNAGSHSSQVAWDWFPESPGEESEGRQRHKWETKVWMLALPFSLFCQCITLSHSSVCSLLCSASTMASPPTGMIFSLCSFLFRCFSLWITLQPSRFTSSWGVCSLELL